MPSFLVWSQHRHTFIKIVHIRLQYVWLYEVTIAVYGISNKKQQKVMKMIVILIQIAVLNQSLMNGSHNTTGNKHQQYVPKVFIQCQCSNISCCHSRKNRIQSIISISNPPQPTFYSPKSESRGSQEGNYGQILRSERFFKLADSFHQRSQRFQKLQNGTYNQSILHLFYDLFQRIIDAPIWMLTKFSLPQHLYPLVFKQLYKVEQYNYFYIYNIIYVIMNIQFFYKRKIFIRNKGQIELFSMNSINNRILIQLQYLLSQIKNMKRSESADSIKEDIKVWQCSACTFKNHPKITECQVCGNTKQEVKVQKKMEGQKQSVFRCHACQYKLDSLVSICPNCGETLIPEQQQQNQQQKKKTTKKEGSTKLLKCLSCRQDNDPSNQICVFCQNSLKQQEASLIPIKKRAARKPRAPRYRVPMPGYSICKYCNLNIYGLSIQDHQTSCGKMGQQQRTIKFLQLQKNYCSFCYQKFEPSQYQFHQKSCSTRKQFYSQSSPTYQRCTKLQIQTMIYMHNKSEKLHWIAQSRLKQKIKTLGYKPSQLQNLHHYIVNYAPIIIHMHVSRHMQFFVKDTHYRNQFQTKKSSGSLSETSRISWQDRMFDRKHHNATPFQRVKYGTINFTNDPKGVRACVGYGQSYFLLKPHVRNRCTVTDMDSSSSSATIATFQFSYHLFNKLPDAQLRAAFEGSKANQVTSSVISAYKQIQIHGPVEFKKDIQRVYVNKTQLADPANEALVKQFCKRNDLEYEVFSQQKPGAAGVAEGLFSFGAPVVAPPSFFGFGSVSTSVPFSAPVYSPFTSHLFGGARPASGLTVPKIPQKQPEQGVDYI